LPEAALFARTYMPSQMTPLAKEWRDSLFQQGKVRVAKTIANPEEHPDLFADVSYGLLAEDAFRRQKAKGPIAAREYSEYKDAGEWDLIGELKKRFPDGVPHEIIASIQQQPISQSPLPVQQVPKPSSPLPPPPQSPPRPQSQLHPELHQSLSHPPSSPSRSVTSTSSLSPRPQLSSPAIETSLPPKPMVPANTNANMPRLVNESLDVGGVEEFVDTVSDNFSHLSMDVNTTGTGSIRGDMDFEEEVNEEDEEDEEVAAPELNMEEMKKPSVQNSNPSPPPKPNLLDDDDDDDDDDLDKLLNS
jgi:coatomer subunit beta'